MGKKKSSAWKKSVSQDDYYSVLFWTFLLGAGAGFVLCLLIMS